jgi:hypothetical protein
MKTPLFVFLGVVEIGTDANISILRNRLEDSFSNTVEELKFEVKDELLIVTIRPPRFCFYISFVNNDHKTLSEWKEMARNFELPWDVKAVDKSRITETFAYLELNGWAGYRHILNLGYTVLQEIEQFSHVKVFTIPSIGKTTIWSKIFKI